MKTRRLILPALICIAAPLAAQSPAPSAGTAHCKPDPHAGRVLYLRGSMTSWAALEEYAFEYRCDAHVLNIDLKGRHEFKVADEGWSAATNFGAGNEGRLVPGGANAALSFNGEHTLRLSFDEAGRGILAVGPKTAADNPKAVVTDPVALSFRFDSRALEHKKPFGAVTTGTPVTYGATAKPGLTKVTLVIEKRRLEGNQDLLEYTEVARLPMARTVSAGAEVERWTTSHRFTEKAIYGIWFELQNAAGATFIYQNNGDSVHWTRERGSGGLGSAAVVPKQPKTIRRFRQTVYDPAFKVPAWAQDVVYYQIFPERFRNGDKRNDPKPGVTRYQNTGIELHKQWLEKPFKPGSGDGSDAAYNNDFFGGDLAGIIEKLPYLRDLGINTLYLTPINQAASNHKYDTADYRRVDPAFGSDADFVRLTREAARRGIRVIPDTSFNHTGSDSVYFDRYGNHRIDGVSKGAFTGSRVQPRSPYASWYRFDTAQADPAKQYKGWGGADLPEVDKSSPDFRRYAYGTGDSSSPVGVTQLWLDRGAAGWRMDVAPWVPDDFWREWRQAVKKHRPDALTVAETWFDSSKYFLGDMFDSTMNYIFRNAVLEYAAGGKAADLVTQFEAMREAYPPQALYALMNLVSSHDQARAVHVLGWHERGDDAAKVALAKQRLKLAAFIQMTTPGAPTIYYGDEVGLDGGDDPYNRYTFPWPDQGGQPDMALHAEFKRLVALRNRHAVLRRGSFGAPLHVDDAVVVYARRLGPVLAITAFNNSATERELRVRLPDGVRVKTMGDALDGGKPVPVRDGHVTLRVPALFGAVLVGR